MTLIEKSTIKFCKDLAANNNREWFAEQKPRYQVALENVKSFQADLHDAMNKFDAIDKQKLYRIYRDVRFSKDKTPYNPDFRISFSREGAQRRGGFYLRIAPGETFIAGGFWNPEPKDLKLIRGHIAQDPKAMRKALNNKKFKDYFGGIEGEQVKTAPKGFDKEHPAIDLLRYKQFLVSKKIPNSIVTSKDFIKELTKGYKAMLPFFDYMSDILTHDLNGIPLYK